MSIDIKPFQERLELLKEYMFLKIENQPMEIWMDLQVCPDEYYIKKLLPLPKPYKVVAIFCSQSFDEFLKTKGYDS